MRPIGTTTVDSSVADITISGQGDGESEKHSSGAAAGGGVEMVGERDGAEEYYGGGEAEVSSHCCGGLSPTTIVYMSAFVSSLTSVLLGYGKLANSPRRRSAGTAAAADL